MHLIFQLNKFTIKKQLLACFALLNSVLTMKMEKKLPFILESITCIQHFQLRDVEDIY